MPTTSPLPEQTHAALLPEQALLYALALAPGGLGRSALLKSLLVQSVRLDGRRPDAQRLEAVLLRLEQQGWLRLREDGQRKLVQLPSARRNQVLHHLCQREDAAQWVKTMQDGLALRQEWMAQDRARTEQALWLHLLAGETEAARQEARQLLHTAPPERLPAIHPVPLLLADAAGRAVFARCAPPLRSAILADYLQLANHFLVLADVGAAYRAGLELVEQLHGGADVFLRKQLLLQAIWRGDLSAQQQLAALSDLGELAAFVQHLMHARPAQALAALEDWLQYERKRSRKRKVELERVLDALRLVAVIGTGNASALQAAWPPLAKTSQRLPGAVLLAQLIKRLLGYAGELNAAQLEHHALAAQAPGLDCLLALLALHWLEHVPPAWVKQARSWRARWLELGYAWLAAEFDAVLAQHRAGEAAVHDWHAERGLTPLLRLHRRREAWEHALDALLHIKPQPGAAVAAEPAARNRRLAWLLEPRADPLRIEPREQKCSAKGQWSKGRAVALRRLQQAADEFDCLTEADRRVIATAQREYSWYGDERWFIPAEAALPHLVGHPHLFLADAPDVRIDLQTGEPSLHLTERDGQIHLRLEPPQLARQEWVLLNETPTRLRLYQRSKEIGKIIEIIGAGLSVPGEARAQLVAAISAIAPLLPVHSDIPELTGNLDSIDGDATLYAHLLPLAEGLRLQLLVRPQADGGWFRPGHGAAHLVSDVDGRPVQIKRNLEDERARLQTVLAHCPALARGESDGQEWRFEHAPDALQLLGELQALDAEAVRCVWPEGERLRIRGRSGLRQLRLTLNRQGDWFALQGNVALDDGRVLQLKHLLELAQATPGRFIALGDGDWLALSDDLRRRLDDLAHLAERIDESGARLSPLAAPLLESLAEEAGEFAADVAWQEQLQRLRSLREFKPDLPRLLQADLRDYQRDGFIWLARLAEWGVGACLADDMGLGKTVQLLALLLHRAKLGPQLVVAPTSVVANWMAEAKRFAPSLRLADYRAARTLDGLAPGHLVLASYGLMQSDQAAFAAQPWASVVLDEAQAVKNAQTKRSHAVMALKADFRVIATGTPLENHLGELWNLFRFINPGLLGSQERFAARFAAPIEAGDSAARRALKQLIQPFLLRRLKSQVLDELPARTDITHTVPLSDAERHQYEALRQQAVDDLARVDADAPEGEQRFKVLAQITRLRRFCCHPSLVLPGSQMESSKLKALARIIHELIDNGHRALVFSQFVDHLAIVRQWLDSEGISYQYLDGATPAKARAQAVEAFQAGQGDIFLISLKAGGSGLNLTAADYVIHLDPWWNPAVEDQASDRAHRIGQQRPVTVYRLVAEHTIEEQIVALHAHKRDLADSLLEGGQASAKLDAQALLELIRQA